MPAAPAVVHQPLDDERQRSRQQDPRQVDHELSERPRNDVQSPYAAAIPALAAAGIVVIEMNPPISAADVAVVSESIPATPAQDATKNEKKSGLETSSTNVCSCVAKSSDVRPVALKTSAARMTAEIAHGNPTPSQRGAAGEVRRRGGGGVAAALQDRHADAGDRAAPARSGRRRCRIATQMPAIGPNSGDERVDRRGHGRRGGPRSG